MNVLCKKRKKEREKNRKKRKETTMRSLCSKRQTSKAIETQYIFTYKHHWYVQHASFTTRPSTDKTCKQQRWRVTRQHCALHTIHICYSDIKQGLMIWFTVCQGTTMHNSPLLWKLSVNYTAILFLTNQGPWSKKVEVHINMSLTKKLTDSVLFELTHQTAVNNIKNCHPWVK